AVRLCRRGGDRGGDAAYFVSDASCHQPHPTLEPPMVAGVMSAQASVPMVRREPVPVRMLLIGAALLFLILFLVLPLVAVFIEALRGGFGAYLAEVTEPEAMSAIKLTLIVAAIAVPLNLVFCLAASWAIAKFEFWGKSFLTTLIDLPFSVSPVIS